VPGQNLSQSADFVIKICAAKNIDRFHFHIPFTLTTLVRQTDFIVLLGEIWDVGGEGVATVLIITVPAGLEDFLREYHEATSMPDEVKDQIAAKYGIGWIRNHRWR